MPLPSSLSDDQHREKHHVEPDHFDRGSKVAIARKVERQTRQVFFVFYIYLKRQLCLILNRETLIQRCMVVFFWSIKKT